MAAPRTVMETDMNANVLAERLSHVIYPVMILAGMAWGATGEGAMGLTTLIVLSGLAIAHPAQFRCTRIVRGNVGCAVRTDYSAAHPASAQKSHDPMRSPG